MYRVFHTDIELTLTTYYVKQSNPLLFKEESVQAIALASGCIVITSDHTSSISCLVGMVV